MDEKQFEQILQAKSQEERSSLVTSLELTIESVQFLKDRSAADLRTDPTKALAIARAAYDVGESISPIARAYGGWSLANALVIAQEYQQAEKYFLQTRSTFFEHELPLDAERVSIGLVYVWAYLGKNSQAFSLSKEIEDALQDHQEDPADQTRLVNLLMNVSIIYELQGQYEESISIYQKLLELAKNLADPLLTATLYHNMAYAFVWLNGFHDAHISFQEAEHIFVRENAYTELIRLYINRLALSIKLNDLDTAEQTLKKAQAQISVVESNFNSVYRLVLYQARLALISQCIPPNELMVKLQEAQRFFSQSGRHSEEGLAWLAIGEFNLRNRCLSQAQVAFKEASRIANANVERSLTYSSVYGLARALDGLDKQEEAVSLYEEALDEIELIRQRMHVDLYRSSFLVDKLTIYQDLARLYLSLNKLGKVYYTTERARSRLIAEKLLTQFNYSSPSKFDVQKINAVAKVPKFHENVSMLKTLYQQAELKQIYQQKTERDPILTDSILHLEKELNEQIRIIQLESQFFSPLAVGNIASSMQVQSRLKSESLLYYHIIHDEIWAFVVTAKEIAGHQQLGTLPDVNSLVDSVMLAVERAIDLTGQLGVVGASAIVKPLLKNVNGYLHQLYEILLDPLVPDLDLTQTLIISADGPLNMIPFHALFDGIAYLIEKTAVCYVPSGTVLDICLSKRNPPRTTLLMGYEADDLAQISNEIKSIMSLVEQAAIYENTEATAERFLQQAPNCGLIHLAMHARFRSDNSMLSYLQFADRYLFFAELSRMRIQADLVVLSGCETGTGKNNGSDLLSLASAFFGAGARSLLVSLWRVEDKATALQMQSFYTLLNQGYTKSDALRQAQLNLIEQGLNQSTKAIYQHPAFWAPFALLGNWR
ncbi:MAG: CHAT domain-containing tetratricopeptide repeat protein [Chloroflexota bacterium]